MGFARVRVLGDCNQKESSLRTKSYSMNHPTPHAALLKCLQPPVKQPFQGHKFIFHLTFCSVLGRLESWVNIYTKSRGERGGGFGNNCMTLQKGKSSCLELEMCWPPLHYQVPHSHLYPVVEHCQQNSQKNLNGLRVQTNTRQSVWGTESHQLSGGINSSAELEKN